MRTWFPAMLLTAAATWLAAAQPPANPADPPPIVIKPKGYVDPTPAAPPEKKDPPGVIVIRPKGPGQPQPQPQPEPKPVAEPAQPAPLAKAAGTIVYDYWFAAAVEGRQIGYLHWTATDVERNGRKLRTGTKYQKFTVSRFGQAVTQFAEESTTESADGEVLVTSFRQGIGANQALAIGGVVDGKVLKVTGEGAAKGAADTPWPPGVVGVAREPLLFREHRLQPGETFEYLSYVPPVNRVVKVTVTFEGEQTLGLWPNTPPKRLLKYVARMAPIGTFRLPPSTTWCDPTTGEPDLIAFKYAPLGGQVTFLRTNEQAATAPVTRPVELFNAQSIRLPREVPNVHTRSGVVYKVSMPEDDDPASAFAADARQRVLNYDPATKTFELHVGAAHGPVAGAKLDPAPGKEHLGSSYFINWDNELVKGHAAKAAAGLGANAGAWEKAVAVERWVHRNMKAFEFSQAMATADNVARTLSGDCTEYAMLTAAMCRALGVPSRTAVGLVHAAGRDGGFYLAYHMWAEVYADGQWVPVDATLGMGGVGPGHVKIADASWHDERSFAPLLPMLRVLVAKPTVEVLKVAD